MENINKKSDELADYDVLLIQHEEVRRQLWCNAWLSLSNAVNCLRPESATNWADAALKDFDKRFPKPPMDTIKLNKFLSGDK